MDDHIAVTEEEVLRSMHLYDLEKQIRVLDHPQVLFAYEPERERDSVDDVVIASGSFDPFTVAHVGMCNAGSDALVQTIPELLIVTTTHHYDKRIDLRKNATFYDRIHCQEQFARKKGNTSLAFFNDPFFVNALGAIRKEYGPKPRLHFLVGSDLFERIVDPKSYTRGAWTYGQAMQALFSDSDFIVSTREITYRDGRPPRTLTGTQIAHEYGINQRFVTDVELDKHAVVSSTLVRSIIDKGGDGSHFLAPNTLEFVTNRQMYRSNNAYEAFVCAREMATRMFSQLPPEAYIDSLMGTIEAMNWDPMQRDMIINNHIDLTHFFDL